MFMGQYNHSIDAKGRIIVPAKLREELGDNFVVTKGFDGCLFVYSEQGWHAFEEKFNALPLNNKDVRQLTRFFLAGASACEVDKQGRFILPSYLREFAGLDKDVVMIGAGSRVEIWDKAKWDDCNENYDENMDDVAEHMQELGFTF
jgi:MraZ protein